MASGSRSDIHITGVGLVTPLGTSADETWRNVLAGRCGMGPMPALESPLPPGKDGGQCPDLPADFAPDLPREARYLRYAIDAALESAGVATSLPCEPDRACVLLGTTLHGMRAAGRFLRSNDRTELQNFLAGDTLRLATRHLPIHGGSATTCSACSSSLGSIALGVTLLQSGTIDLVIAGGYDAVSEYAYAGFNALRLVSEPPLRPFTKGRVGMKLSEAYAIVILQRADAGKRSIATISGWGESADAHHLTQPHPTGDGALAAMKQALDRAGIAPQDLGLIAAHATGTPDNDSSEAAALTRLLGGYANGVPVVGFKSHLGHTLGGAGAAELILSALAIRDQIVPATANIDPAQLEFPNLRITHGASQPGAIQHTLNTSLGFGGANTCVVLSVAATPASPIRMGDAGVAATKAVITGVGVLLPGMIGNDAFVARVRSNERFDPTQTLTDADFEHLLNARRTRRMSAYVKMTLAAVSIACADAKLEAGFSAAGILGSMHGSAAYSDEYYAQIVREGMPAANPMLFAEGVPNAAAAQLSLMLGLKQACQTIIGTRTAGLDALRLAAMRIEQGHCDRVIVSAGEESHATVDAAYNHCGLRGDNGFLNVSGAVAIIVESHHAAAARGARVYATIGASRSASGPVEAAADTVARAIVRADQIVGSANHTWIDRAERLALRKRELPAARSFYDITGELFSAGALASLVAMLLTDDAANFSILSTDFTGVATSVRIERT